MTSTRTTAAREANDKEDTMGVTASKLIRWSGLAALVAGAIFAGIQPIHPADVVASVTTREWTIITSLKMVMCLLFLVGITGLYARQVGKAGRLGLAGFLVMVLGWAVQSCFVFAEAYILPVLANNDPKFVDGILGISYGRASEVNLGALPALYTLLTTVPYLLGGLLFGIATLRARILPRWPAGILAAVSAVTPAAILLPHHIQRLVGMPVGIAIACLGFALWYEGHAHAEEPALGGISQLGHTGGD